MPAEAHRYTWRLGRRDRLFLWLAALAAVAAVGAILLAGRGSSYAPPANCVAVESAGFMGGIITETCDAKAVALCRSEAGTKGNLPEQCDRLVVRKP